MAGVEALEELEVFSRQGLRSGLLSGALDRIRLLKADIDLG